MQGNTRTTAEEHYQDVRLISFDNTGVVWAPGDVLVVRPQNSDENVDELFRIISEHHLPLNANTLVRITEIDSGKSREMGTIQSNRAFFFSFEIHFFYFRILFIEFIFIVLFPSVFI